MSVSLHLHTPLVAKYVANRIQVRAVAAHGDAAPYNPTAPHLVFTMRPRAARQLARVIARALERAVHSPRVMIVDVMRRKVFIGSSGCVCIPVYGVDVYASTQDWTDSLSAIRAALGE